MRTEEFLSRVAGYVPHLDENAALDLSLPTLELLCEHLPPEEGARLASQLPRQLAGAARAGARRARQARGRIDAINLVEFNDRVAQASALTLEEAEECTRAVARVLRECIERGELVEVGLSLPAGLTDLVRPPMETPEATAPPFVPGADTAPPAERYVPP